MHLIQLSRDPAAGPKARCVIDLAGLLGLFGVRRGFAVQEASFSFGLRFRTFGGVQLWGFPDRVGWQRATGLPLHFTSNCRIASELESPVP